MVRAPPAAARASARLHERPRGQVVDDVDLVPLDQQPVDEGRPDEPGAPCHHRAHAPPSLLRGRRDPIRPAQLSSGRAPSTTDPEGTIAPSPSTDSGRTSHRSPTIAPGPEDRTGHGGAGRHPGPVHSTEPVTEAPASTTQPRPSTLPRPGPRRPPAALHDHTGPDHRPDTNGSPTAPPPVRRLMGTRGRRLMAPTFGQVPGGLEQCRRGARVEPVGVVGQGEQGAVLDHRREGLRSMETRRPAGIRSSTARLEHVGAGVDLVGRRLFPGGLLDEGGHPPVVVGRHDPEGRGVRHRVQGDGALGAALGGGTRPGPTGPGR